MSEPVQTPQENPQSDLQQTADMLEQILEVMPDDLFTLRALYETSLKLEHPEKAFDCLTRLDDLARSTQNKDQIRFVIDQYTSILDAMPDAQKRIDRLQETAAVADLLEGADGSARPAAPARKGVIEAEMALAWELFQDEQLSQEEYSGVLHDLSEMSMREMSVPLTVLHVLHDRNFSRVERLMSHLSQKSEVPIMSLSQYDEREDLREVLPLEFISRHGVLPFAQVGGDLMVAVLNPLDRDLLAQAEKLSGRVCHAYLVTPQEYDQRLAQMRKALAA